MLKNLKKKKNNKGFTLIELLVVIAIIGVLAVVAVPSLFGNINKSKAAKIEADYSAIRTAILASYADGTTIADMDLTKLEIDGANLEADAVPKYELEKTDTNTRVNLKVTAENAKIAEKVKDDIAGASFDDKVITIPIIK